MYVCMYNLLYGFVDCLLSLLYGFVDYSGFEKVIEGRGPCGYLRTWNWPITACKISQPYNKTTYSMLEMLWKVVYCMVPHCTLIRFYKKKWHITKYLLTSNVRSLREYQNSGTIWIVSMVPIAWKWFPFNRSQKFSIVPITRKNRCRSGRSRTSLFSLEHFHMIVPIAWTHFETII